MSDEYVPGNYTLGIIKPDAVRGGKVGAILTMVEDAGLKIAGLELIAPHEGTWREFYAEHASKPYFENLVAFMCSGTAVVMALCGDDAVGRWRKMMGATDPAKAEAGTIRALYGNPLVIRENAVHGSDSPDSALREIVFFAP